MPQIYLKFRIIIGVLVYLDINSCEDGLIALLRGKSETSFKDEKRCLYGSDTQFKRTEHHT